MGAMLPVNDALDATLLLKTKREKEKERKEERRTSKKEEAMDDGDDDDDGEEEEEEEGEHDDEESSSDGKQDFAPEPVVQKGQSLTISYTDEKGITKPYCAHVAKVFKTGSDEMVEIRYTMDSAKEVMSFRDLIERQEEAADELRKQAKRDRDTISGLRKGQDLTGKGADDGTGPPGDGKRKRNGQLKKSMEEETTGANTTLDSRDIASLVKSRRRQWRR